MKTKKIRQASDFCKTYAKVCVDYNNKMFDRNMVMKFGKMFCIVSFTIFLGGCTSDLISPPYEDHPNLKAAEIARMRGDAAQSIKDYRDIIAARKLMGA